MVNYVLPHPSFLPPPPPIPAPHPVPPGIPTKSARFRLAAGCGGKKVGKRLPWFPPRVRGYCTQEAKEITSAGFEMIFVSEGVCTLGRNTKKKLHLGMKVVYCK